jgi:hypothetical protein
MLINFRFTATLCNVLFAALLILLIHWMKHGSEHSNTGYSGNTKFIVPFDTNYCPWLRLGQLMVSHGIINFLFPSSVNKCIIFPEVLLQISPLLCPRHHNYNTYKKQPQSSHQVNNIKKNHIDSLI